MTEKCMLRKTQFNRPSANLFIGAFTVGILGAFSLPVQAQTSEPVAAQSQEFFDNSGILFIKDTLVQFEFVRSFGAYQSVFGVRNEDTGEEIDLIEEVQPSDLSPSEYQQALNNPSDGQTDSPNDFPGTRGNAVTSPRIVEFTFKAGNRYSFYLKSRFRGSNAGVLYSTDMKNPTGNRQAKFIGDFSSLASGTGVFIRWDDTNSQIPRVNQSDNDFDDFIVRAGGYEKCLCSDN
ncbi:MAG: hypothetical protein VKN72_18235 [Nostocales cyanobacterium 94392]|nr:hypothetical protein [Nostocales cyanobacterium 94392]